MNKISFLLKNKFTQFCIEDQLKIKALGRDLPDLNIDRAQNDKSGRNRKFSRALYQKNNWICGCDITNRMYCFPCVLYGGDEHWSEKGVDDLIHVWEKIKTHERSAQHMHNTFSLSMLGKVDIKILSNSALRTELLNQNELVRKHRHDLDKVINGIRFCSAFELALRGHDRPEASLYTFPSKELINFNEDLYKENKESLEKFPFFKGIVQNVLTELVECIFGVCREEIIKQVKSAEYLGIIIDEVYDFSCKSQLIVIVRYLLNGKPVERFWNILYPDAYDANSIGECILKEIDPLLQQTPEKLVSLSYDGPAVVSGSLAIIQARIQQKCPKVRYVHYYGHSVNLIISSAASGNKQAKIFFSSLCSLCSFISNTPQVVNMLVEIVQRRSASGTAPAFNFDITSGGVKTIYEYRKDLIMVMDYLEKSANDATVNLAGGFKFRLQDKHFIFWLGIFNKVVPHVVCVFNMLDKEGIDSIRMNDELKRFENAMFGIQQKMDVVISETENEINSSVDLDDEEDEPVAKKPRLLNHGKRKEEALELCNAIMRHVVIRFSGADFLNCTNLFKVTSFREYRMKFPTKLLGEPVKQFGLEKQKLTTELQVVYERPELRVISGLVPLLNLVADPDLDSVFPEIVKLLSIFCTMPIGTVEAERCFPTLKQIKTFLRNTSSQSSNLSALVLLSVEKSFVNDIDDFNHKVINFYAAKKKRLEFVYRKV